MFYPTLPQDTQDFSQVLSGVGRSLREIGRSTQYLPYDVLGAPVDLATLAMRPFGYETQTPTGGSDWLIELARQYGLADKPTGSGIETATRLATGITSPTAVPRAIGKFAQGLDRASDITTEQANRAADALVRQITGNPQATAQQVIQETSMPFMQAVAPKSTKRADVQSEAKSFGLPATGKTEEIQELVDIVKSDPRTWTREQYDLIRPHLAIHQDFRPGSAERSESIMKEGLRSGMVDSLDAMQSGRYSYAGGLVGSDAYLFPRGILKYKSSTDPHLAPGNIPLFKISPEKGQDIYDAIVTTAQRQPKNLTNLLDTGGLLGKPDLTQTYQQISNKVDELYKRMQQESPSPSLLNEYKNLRAQRDELGAKLPLETQSVQQSLLEQSYKGSHTAPKSDVYGATFDNLQGIMPSNVYSQEGKRLYGLGDSKVDSEWYMSALKAKGKPDADVTVYRAVPKGIKDINDGDWVTPSKEYARLHGERTLDGDYEILSKKVKAKTLSTEGYPYELGYNEIVVE